MHRPARSADVDGRADPAGAREQGHQGGRSCASTRPAAALRLGAGSARARSDARRRQAGRDLDGQRRGLGRLLDLDRVRRGHRRRVHDHRLDRRLRHPADRRQALDKLGIHLAGVRTTWLRNAAIREGRSIRAWLRSCSRTRSHLRRLHGRSRRRASRRPRRSTPSRKAVSGPARRPRSAASSTPRHLRRCPGVGGEARQARRLAALAYIERDPGNLSRLVGFFSGRLPR